MHILFWFIFLMHISFWFIILINFYLFFLYIFTTKIHLRLPRDPSTSPTTRHVSLFSQFQLHTEKSFRNIIASNRNQIVFTNFWLIWNQTDGFRLVPNRSINGNHNLISGWFNKISLCEKQRASTLALKSNIC